MTFAHHCMRTPRWICLAGAALSVLGCVGSETSLDTTSERSEELLPAAPDATGLGPLSVTTSEYHLPAAIDNAVIPQRQTEIWAAVTRPTDLSLGPFPVVVLLHGNHPTCGDTNFPRTDGSCEYSTTGVCSAPFPVVTPNHLGYTYLADRLATWGYVVVQPNVNLGINCSPSAPGDSGLNLTRGRMILRHLEVLSSWNRFAGTTPASLGVDLAGALDFSHVGLFGHSRAGEGIRAAKYYYEDPASTWPAKIVDPVGFEGLFEIGGNDGQSGKTLDALGTPWHQILPACDGDNFTLPGVRPFDRMIRATSESVPSPKSYSLIRGSNHAFYSTEWQISDASGCGGSNNAPIFDPAGYESQAERDVATALFMAFFRGHVQSPVSGANDVAFAATFNPLYALGGNLTSITQVDRSYTSSPDATITKALDDMTSPLSDISGVSLTYEAIPRHDPGLRAAKVLWQAAGPSTYFQKNWAPTGLGRDVSQDAALEFRISRVASNANSANFPTNFSIQLVDANGAMSSPVALSSYITLNGTPVGPTGVAHMTLRSVRIPIADFTGMALTKVRGMRFTFDLTQRGAVYITNIRRRLATGAAASYPFSAEAPEGSVPKGISGGDEAPVETASGLSLGAKMVGVRPLSGDLGPGGEVYRGGLVIELETPGGFPVSGELPTLRVGPVSVTMSAYPDGRDLRRLAFMLTREEAASLRDGAKMSVRYGDGSSPLAFEVGSFRAER